MSKSAREVMRENLFNSLAECAKELKRNNVDNGIVRDVKAIHDNTTFNDLPDYLQQAINRSVQNAFVRMASEKIKVVSED